MQKRLIGVTDSFKNINDNSYNSTLYKGGNRGKLSNALTLSILEETYWSVLTWKNNLDQLSHNQSLASAFTLCLKCRNRAAQMFDPSFRCIYLHTVYDSVILSSLTNCKTSRDFQADSCHSGPPDLQGALSYLKYYFYLAEEFRYHTAAECPLVVTLEFTNTRRNQHEETICNNHEGFIRKKKYKKQNRRRNWINIDIKLTE